MISIFLALFVIFVTVQSLLNLMLWLQIRDIENVVYDDLEISLKRSGGKTDIEKVLDYIKSICIFDHDKQHKSEG